jgi:hypothetical protein
MKISSRHRTDHRLLVVGFDQAKLAELQAGVPVKFKLSQFGVEGVQGDRHYVIIKDGPEMVKLRQQKVVPLEYARIDCLASATIKQLQNGGKIELPLCRNKLQTLLVGSDDESEMSKAIGGVKA